MKEITELLSSFDIEIDGVVWANRYGEDIQIDRTALDSEFITHSERFAYYATLAEMSDEAYTEAKEEMEAIVALIDDEIRTSNVAAAMAAGGVAPKKLTETQVEHAIKLDKRYQNQLTKVQHLRKLAKMLKYAPKAFEHRKDMLVQMGANYRNSDSPRILSEKQEAVKTNLAAKHEDTEDGPRRRAPKTT
jgi:hypothetical protein